MREGLLCLSAVGEAGGRALSGLLVLSGQVLTTRLYMYVYTIVYTMPRCQPRRPKATDAVTRLASQRLTRSFSDAMSLWCRPDSRPSGTVHIGAVVMAVVRIHGDRRCTDYVS